MFRRQKLLGTSVLQNCILIVVTFRLTPVKRIVATYLKIYSMRKSFKNIKATLLLVISMGVVLDRMRQRVARASSVRGIPIPILFPSDAVTVTVDPAAPTSGKISAIRIQDIARQMWFEYNNGVWDSPPAVLPGTENLYIGMAAVNEGADGELTVEIKTAGYSRGTKTEHVISGNMLGLEANGGLPMGMPSSPLVVECTVIP